MEPDGKDDAAALMVLAALVLLVLAVIGIGAYLAFSEYTSAAQGM
jgi:hypothetical protein